MAAIDEPDLYAVAEDGMTGRNLWQFTHALSAHGDLSPDMETFLDHSREFRLPVKPEDAEERKRRVEQDRKREAACGMRRWMHDNLEGIQPQPGQRPDTHLEPYIGLPALAKKGTDVFTKVMEGDYQLAEQMSKEMHWPFQVCLDAIIKVNRLATLSFEGGDLIRKGARDVPKTKIEKEDEKLRKQAIAELQKGFGAHPPEAVQRAVARLLIADHDYRANKNEFTKAALHQANQHARQVISYAQARRIVPGQSPGSVAQFLAAR